MTSTNSLPFYHQVTISVFWLRKYNLEQISSYFPRIDKNTLLLLMRRCQSVAIHLTSDPESGGRSIPHGSRKKSASRGHLAEANLRKKLNAAADAGGPDMVTGFFQMANDFMANRIEEFPDPALDSMTLPPKSELSHPLPLTPEPLPSSPERRIRLTIRRINGQFVIGV